MSSGREASRRFLTQVIDLSRTKWTETFELLSPLCSVSTCAGRDGPYEESLSLHIRSLGRDTRPLAFEAHESRDGG